MKNKILIVILVSIIFTTLTKAQDPLSFFPHGVGDRWEYVDNWGNLKTQTIIRDSIGFDSSHNLFYDTYYFYPKFRIDTNLNIFEAPQEGWNFLLYKLDADVGDIWENPQSGGGRWAWVTRMETAYVFSKLTTIKIFRYGPGRPDSANSPGFLENWLACGFGLIYSDYNYGFTYLQGCIIAGDTFGIVTSVKDILTEIPEVFKLNQNYPNPFNPTTTIEFELAHEAEVNIYVYDILGQQITILYSGYKPAGIHKIKWNASGLTSGVYLCRLQANDKVSSIKMLLAR